MIKASRLPAYFARLRDLRSRWWIPAIGLGLVFTGLILLEMHQISKGNLGAFGTYYMAGLRMRKGRSPYGDMGIYPYVYPPFYAFICQPLTCLSHHAAARIAAVVNGAILLCAVIFAARGVVSRFGYERNRAAILWIALITAGITLFPLDKAMRSLQVNGLLVLSLVLALDWLERRPVLAGFALAMGISVKYFPVIGLIYLVLRRRWTAAIATVAGCAVFALLPALSVGWSANLHYQQMANRGLANLLGGAPPEDAAKVHGLTDTTNISVPSTMARLTEQMHWPHSAGLALTALVFIAWAGVVIWMYRRGRIVLLNWPNAAGQGAAPFRWLLALEWSLLATLPLVFIPDSEQVFAIMPATVLAAMLALPGKSQNRQSVLWALGLILAAVILPISLMGRPLTNLWNGLGTPCWLWLIALALIWKHGLGEATPAGNAHSNPSPLAMNPSPIT